MTIFDEIGDLRKVWQDASPLVKIVVFVFAVLTLSPLASLSDTLISWRGFLQDGLDAYRQLISKPVIRFMGRVGWSYTQFEIDTLFAMGWQYLGAIRVATAHFPRNWRTVAFIAVNVLTWLGFVAIYGLNEDQTGWYEPLAFAALFVWYGRYLAKSYGKSVSVVYFAPALISIVLVLVLGAVNVAFL